MDWGKETLRKVQAGVIATTLSLTALVVPAAAQDREYGGGHDRCEQQYDRGYRESGYGYGNGYRSDNYYRDDQYRYGNDWYGGRSIGKSAAIIAGSAGAGAIVGGLTHGRRGAAIGAVVGGVGGVIVDRATAHRYPY